MSDIAVSVENVSKRYLIGHQSVQHGRYTTLRDVLGREARNFLHHRLIFSRQANRQGDEIELWALGCETSMLSTVKSLASWAAMEPAKHSPAKI
jgi:hypothetical protein